MSDQMCRWEEAFRVMECEWKKIHQQKMASDMIRWEERFAKMNDEYQRLVSCGQWVSGPSDFLSIIGRQEDERTHSRMLAWLLTPTGRHGLRNLVLMRLLQHYDSKRGDAEAMQAQSISRAADCLYNVECSCWRNNREADIVVWAEDFTLVIEMKVNAGEQEKQCDDLYENFKAEPGRRFLFLTRDGEKPETATTPDAQREWETISWPKVRCMIEGALNDPVSKKASALSIVENYVLTLRENFE